MDANPPMSAVAREELRRLVDQLPEPDVVAALRFMESLFSRSTSFEASPQEAEELSEFGEDVWADGVADLDAGRKHTLEEVKREFGL